jgi:hypothetical protein
MEERAPPARDIERERIAARRGGGLVERLAAGPAGREAAEVDQRIEGGAGRLVGRAGRPPVRDTVLHTLVGREVPPERATQIAHRVVIVDPPDPRGAV